MLRKALLFGAAVAFALALPAVSQAQVTGGATVINSTTCPVAQVVNVGNNRPFIETLYGALCTNASGGGGGGGAVTAVAGAFADGWSVTGGLTTDTACATDNGVCTEIALMKRTNQRMTSMITALGTPFQAGGSIGNFPSTVDTNKGVATASTIRAETAMNATPTIPINISSATTTQIVPLSGSTSIYVTSLDFISGGIDNVTFEYGTGSNCATGTTTLTGAYPLTAQAGEARGNGGGTILFVPSGNALCILTSANVQLSGSLTYKQF